MKYNKRMIDKQAHFAIKKLSIGAAAVLVSTSMYLGMRSSNVLADTNNDTANTSIAKNNDSNSSEESSSNSETVSSQNNKNSSAVTETPVEAPAQNDDQAGHSTSEVDAPLQSAPLYTTQGQLPALDMNSMFPQEQLSQYGDNPQIDWVTKPNVSKIGNVTGTAKLTYEDMDADPTEDGAVPTKETMVNVPVLVRKAEQEVAANQVKNSLDVINSSNNSLVAHYEWVGDKAANDEDEGISIPGRDDLESNFMSIIENLGFELDDGSEFPEDLMTFGTTNKSATMFVHPTSTAPVITEDPYFDADGNSSIDNVSNNNPDAANYIGNLGVLPEGTKIEWKAAPTYNWQKEDGNYINSEPTNSPSIKVTIPGKDPIILDSDPNGVSLKEIATLPDYGDSTLLISPNNTLNLGDSVNEPTDYVTNLDSFIRNYLENDGKQVNDDNIQDFKKSFGWTIKPNTQQAGYTFGVFKYNDNVGNLILFKVIPTKVDNSKTITRTITFKGLPQDLIPKVDPQTVTVKQKGQQTYVDEPIEWGSAKFDAVTAPTIEGYRVTNPDAAPEKAVTAETTDSTVTFTYTANDQSTTIKYVNNADHNDVVGTQPVNGKTGETVNVTYKAPENWKIVAGQPAGETITFGSTPVEDTIVYVEHGTKDVTDDPTQADKVKKTITRTVDLDIAGKTSEYTKQSVTIYRTATEDLVTGEITYGAWNVDGAKFDAVPAPAEAGYTVQNPEAAKAMAVTGDTQDSTVTFTYTANDQSATIKYVNNADHNDVVGTQPVNGKTGETVKVTYKAPENWKIVAGQPAGETITFGSTPVEDTIVYVEHGTKDVTNDPTQADKVNKTITRTIDLDIAGKTSEYKKQIVTLHRSATQDLVTKEVTYGAWNVDGAKFDAVPAPAEAGYTVTNPNAASEVAVTDDTQDSTVTFTYTANDQSATIKYVNNADHNDVVGTQSVNGKTGETVNVTYKAPENWKIVAGQPTGETITFGSTKVEDTIVYVEHGTEDVTDTDAKAKSTITETINITTPDGKTTPIVKTVTFNRTATKDLVTGDVTYGAWSDNGTYTFPSYTAPEEPGYTPSQNEVPAQTVKPGDKDLVFDITYSAGEHTQVINYVDKNGKVIYTYNVTGMTGESVQTNIEKNVPKNWVIVGGQEITTSVIFGSENPAPINVIIEHGTKDVTNDPTQADKVNKTITRTIDLDIAGKTSEYKKQTVTLHRSATQDLITKEVTYGAWNVDGAKFDAVTAPAEAGYTVTNPKAAPEEAVTAETADSTVTFTYTANDQGNAEHTQVINYVDKTGKVISSYNVTGKTGETVETSIEKNVPAGWVISSGQQIATSVTFGSDNPAPIKVIVVKKETATDTPITVDQPVKVVIIYKDKNGDTVGTTDKDYKNGDKVIFDIPEGYIPGEKVPDVIATPGTGVITIPVIKKETATDTPITVDQPVKVVIIYKNKNGDIVGTTDKDYKNGDKVIFDIPEGYIPGEKVPDIIATPGTGVITVPVIKKETATDTPITVDQPVKVVIIYKDKNGDTVGTTDKDYKNGDKVIFDIPEGYIPGEKVPDIVATPGTGVIIVPVIKKGTDTPKTPMDKPSYNHPQEPSRDIMISTKKALPENKKIAADKPINVINTDSIQSNVKVIKATNKKKNNLISKKELPQTGNKSMVNSLLGLVVMTGSMILGFISKKKKN